MEEYFSLEFQFTLKFFISNDTKCQVTYFMYFLQLPSNFAVMDPINTNEFSAIDILIDDTIFEIFNWMSLCEILLFGTLCSKFRNLVFDLLQQLNDPDLIPAGRFLRLVSRLRTELNELELVMQNRVHRIILWFYGNRFRTLAIKIDYNDVLGNSFNAFDIRRVPNVVFNRIRDIKFLFNCTVN